MKIAIVRIRGKVRADQKTLDTMKMLHLHRQNYCAVVESNPSVIGMLSMCKDYVTWGEIDDETYSELVAKRQKKTEGVTKPYFRLNPPRGGFERKGIKKGFGQGGALGYRGAEINILIKKMM
jgi:large subunit ribosomal protein L30